MIEHNITTEGVVNQSEMITLFDDAGRAIQADIKDTAHWMNLGFNKEKVDVVSMKERLPFLVTAVEETLGVLLKENPEQDHGDIATASMALNDLNALVAQIMKFAHGKTRIDVSDSVEMVDAEGESHMVDLGQVDLYKNENGWGIK